MNLTVSAQNSNITITDYQTFNTADSNTTFTGASLSYTTVGQGTQIFNFDLKQKGGTWSVLFNEAFVAENEGWTISPNQTLTITDTTSNVTIFYFDFSGAFGGFEDTSNLPFYQQHSVVIAVGVSVAAVAVLSFAINRRNRTKESEQMDKIINEPVTQGSG